MANGSSSGRTESAGSSIWTIRTPASRSAVDLVPHLAGEGEARGLAVG